MRYLVFTIAVLLSVSSLLAQIAVDAQHWWPNAKWIAWRFR